MEIKYWLIEGIVKFAAVIVNYFEIVLLGRVCGPLSKSGMLCPR